jgi:hypothetical protein
MKKKILYLTIIFVCLCTNDVFAQWGFNATLRVTGECTSDYKPIYPLPNITGFPTKAECETVRNIILNISEGNGYCRAYYSCTACVGHDIAGNNQGTGSLNTNGTNQGSSYYSNNAGAFVQDAAEQKQYQNDMLFGTNNSNQMLATTGDKKYDVATGNLIKSRREAPTTDKAGGRVEGYFNYQSYQPKGGYGFMKELGESVGLNFSDYMSEELWNKASTGKMSFDEAAEFNKKYDQFVHDVSVLQNPSVSIEQIAIGSLTNWIDEQAITTRLSGLLQAIGGASEFMVGTGFAVATGWTVGGAVAGGLFAAHGVDQTVAGVSKLITGKEQNTVTSAVFQVAGMSENTANVVDNLVSIGGGISLALSPIKIYRVSSINSTGKRLGVLGESWTPVNPKTMSAETYRNVAGLKDFNKAEILMEGTVKYKNISSVRKAQLWDKDEAIKFLDENRGFFPYGERTIKNGNVGGLREIMISDYEKNVKIISEKTITRNIKN